MVILTYLVFGVSKNDPELVSISILFYDCMIKHAPVDVDRVNRMLRLSLFLSRCVLGLLGALIGCSHRYIPYV